MSSKLSLPLILQSILDQRREPDLDSRLASQFQTTMAQLHLEWAMAFFRDRVIPLIVARAGLGIPFTTIMSFCPEDIRYVDPHATGALEWKGHDEEEMLFHGRAAALIEVVAQAGLKLRLERGVGHTTFASVDDLSDLREPPWLRLLETDYLKMVDAEMGPPTSHRGDRYYDFVASYQEM
jgi:hypothetical protein